MRFNINMQINKITTTSFMANKPRKLVPLSEYKGTILELTDGDRKAIKELQTKIGQCEARLYRFIEKCSNSITNINYYNDTILMIEDEIKTLREEIRNIKKNRLFIQNLNKK